MPKKKSNKYSGKTGRAEMGSDDESVFNDNASLMSNVSDGSQYKDEFAHNEDATGDDLTQDEVFEEKLREAMDMATQKSANGRTNALKALCTGFFKRYLPDFVDDRRVTLTDIVDKAVKKGKADEKVAAANLAVMICVELGTSTVAEEVFKDLKPLFTTQILDNSVSSKARAALASALGAICFLSSSDLNEFPQVMDTMETVFKASYNNNEPTKHTEDILSLHEAALSSWTLLLTLLPPSKAFKLLESHVTRFGDLLASTDVDLRIATGEALVVLYESAVEFNEDEAFSLVEGFLPELKQLATDSQKFRSKKDRKEQKSSFRDILKYIEDNDEFYEKISINSGRETVELLTWAQKIQYTSLCKAMGAGMSYHLKENELIREVFELGEPLPYLLDGSNLKPSKQERNSRHQQASKWRTQTRGKNRDKRSQATFSN
ncbi:interferon-related developmental regulator 1-like isoform X2 [Tigriopus californicus]|uniref:interferon-related developmental regulator 1-like isoform X2 n=1 Tax=Tigriopus californicus TaxID=6832 RepID=UPI0027DA0CC2|nr:interferon-related developmental regulator 1-like isoform X2 [Tigriopus californicus]